MFFLYNGIRLFESTKSSRPRCPWCRHIAAELPNPTCFCISSTTHTRNQSMLFLLCTVYFLSFFSFRYSPLHVFYSHLFIHVAHLKINISIVFRCIFLYGCLHCWPLLCVSHCTVLKNNYCTGSKIQKRYSGVEMWVDSVFGSKVKNWGYLLEHSLELYEHNVRERRGVAQRCILPIDVFEMYILE